VGDGHRGVQDDLELVGKQGRLDDLGGQLPDDDAL
jgi:hypothetical protein